MEKSLVRVIAARGYNARFRGCLRSSVNRSAVLIYYSYGIYYLHLAASMYLHARAFPAQSTAPRRDVGRKGLDKGKICRAINSGNQFDLRGTVTAARRTNIIGCRGGVGGGPKRVAINNNYCYRTNAERNNGQPRENIAAVE